MSGPGSPSVAQGGHAILLSEGPTTLEAWASDPWSE